MRMSVRAAEVQMIAEDSGIRVMMQDEHGTVELVVDESTACKLRDALDLVTRRRAPERRAVGSKLNNLLGVKDDVRIDVHPGCNKRVDDVSKCSFLRLCECFGCIRLGFRCWWMETWGG